MFFDKQQNFYFYIAINECNSNCFIRGTNVQKAIKEKYVIPSDMVAVTLY